MPKESKITLKARQKIIQLYRDKGYQVTEEELFPCKNNIEEVNLSLDYQADIIVTKKFLIELDPYKLHDTHIHTVKDAWRDKNIYREYKIKTVRIDPNDVMKQDPIDIIIEVDDQLNTFKQRYNIVD
jgi:hypothetical protein